MTSSNRGDALLAGRALDLKAAWLPPPPRAFVVQADSQLR